LPAALLQIEAFVLLKRPPAEAFQGCTFFSGEHGVMTAFVRVPKKAGSRVALDLFDEAALHLESSSQGRTWFVREARILSRASAIGRSYEALVAASSLAAVIARNPPAPESYPQVGALLRAALAAFGGDADPDVVLFKSLYRFARDEGYPLAQEWLPSLPADLRGAAEHLLRSPLAELPRAAERLPSTVALQRRLEDYIRGHTDILLD
jgi:hypothetical protein